MNDHLHSHSPITATIFLVVSLGAGFFGWIGWTSMQEWMRFVSLIISMIAGIMAIRYYYYSTKKNK